jgi:hypothetical protein
LSIKTVARHRVQWCNRKIEWTALALDEECGPWPRNAVWSYEMDGLTFFGFPFDPLEAGSTTTQRALNWLNQHHLLVRREHSFDAGDDSSPKRAPPLARE